MKKSVSLWQWIGFIFTGVFGTLLHFLYDWSNQNFLIALFSAINESIWEHMKLLFFPMFLFAIIQSHFFDEQYKNFWCVKLIGILVGILIIPILYYTYTGIFGVSIDWINILIFFLASAITYSIETRLLKQENFICSSPQTALIILCSIAFIFVIFTFVPPHIPLFQDPRTTPTGNPIGFSFPSVAHNRTSFLDFGNMSINLFE